MLKQIVTIVRSFIYKFYQIMLSSCCTFSKGFEHCRVRPAYSHKSNSSEKIITCESLGKIASKVRVHVWMRTANFVNCKFWIWRIYSLLWRINIHQPFQKKGPHSDMRRIKPANTNFSLLTFNSSFASFLIHFIWTEFIDHMPWLYKCPLRY